VDFLRVRGYAVGMGYFLEIVITSAIGLAFFAVLGFLAFGIIAG